MKNQNGMSKVAKNEGRGGASIEFSLFAWAQAIGMDRATLTKRLRVADIRYKPHGKISAANIYRALAGDDKQARARRDNAQAEMLESKVQERVGNLVNKDIVQTAMRNFCLPVRQRLNSLASECAHLCNPTDPLHARAALEDWVKRALPAIREEKQKLETNF